MDGELQLRRLEIVQAMQIALEKDDIEQYEDQYDKLLQLEIQVLEGGLKHYLPNLHYCIRVSGG